MLGVYLGTVELNLQYLERSESGPELSAEAWERNFQRAQAIANWAPQHAAAQDLVARIAQRGAGSAPNPADAVRLHQTAIKYGHKSLRIRPGWAPSWLNLAASKFVLDANGSDWQSALERVFKIGDRNLRSQLALAKFRKQVDAKLSAKQRQQFQIASAQAQLDYEYDFTLAVIRLARQNWVCPTRFALEAAEVSSQRAYQGLQPGVNFDAEPSFDPKKVLTASALANINSVCENALN